MATTVSNNLNVDSIVSALMKPYQQKVATMDKSIASYEVKLTDLSKLKSSLTNLRTQLQDVEDNEKEPLTPEKLKTELKEFVNAFNTAVKTTQNSTDTSIKRFTQKLRDEIDPVISNKIGLSFDKTGQAQFNEYKFDSLETSDHAALNSAVNTVFDKALGASSNINTILMTGGKIDYSEGMYNKKVSELTTKKERLEDQMVVYEATYRRQFTALQKMLITMDSNQELMSNLLKTSA